MIQDIGIKALGIRDYNQLVTSSNPNDSFKQVSSLKMVVIVGVADLFYDNSEKGYLEQLANSDRMAAPVNAKSKTENGLRTFTFDPVTLVATQSMGVNAAILVSGDNVTLEQYSSTTFISPNTTSDDFGLNRVYNGVPALSSIPTQPVPAIVRGTNLLPALMVSTDPPLIPLGYFTYAAFKFNNFLVLRNNQSLTLQFPPISYGRVN